jgi:DnaJ-class molecular chaperone
MKGNEKSTDKAKELFTDGQLSKTIYLRQMSAMKDILNLGEMKFGDRNNETYRYFKKVVMDAFYVGMSDVFEALAREGLVEKCDCGTGIRQGYKTCAKCNGAGYKNTDEFNDWITSGT